MKRAWLRRARWADDRGMLGVAAALLIVMVLAGGALIYDGGRALVAQRQIINVAEGAARAGTNTIDEGGLQQGPATAAAQAFIDVAGVPDSDVVSITVTPGPGHGRPASPPRWRVHVAAWQRDHHGHRDRYRTGVLRPVNETSPP